MNITALAIEVYNNEVCQVGVLVFNFDCTISDYWIRRIRRTKPGDQIDFDPEELNTRLAEFLADHSGLPMIVASKPGWNKRLFPDIHLTMDERWLLVDYKPKAGMEDHLDAIMDEVRAERYKWTNR